MHRKKMRYVELQLPGVPTGKGLVRKKEAAADLACSPRMIDRLVVLKKLTRVKILGASRYRQSEIDVIKEKGAL
jgi:hypothetical protein